MSCIVHVFWEPTLNRYGAVIHEADAISITDQEIFFITGNTIEKAILPLPRAIPTFIHIHYGRADGNVVLCRYVRMKSKTLCNPYYVKVYIAHKDGASILEVGRGKDEIAPLSEYIENCQNESLVGALCLQIKEAGGTL